MRSLVFEVVFIILTACIKCHLAKAILACQNKNSATSFIARLDGIRIQAVFFLSFMSTWSKK